MIYSQETSMKQETSQKELMRELLDLIDITSQPEWGMSPIGSPPESETESESLRDRKRKRAREHIRKKWSDEENPGGEGPPLIPPQ
uniref:ORF3 n=1 Tax=Torque teno Leptonychotes weddellii virus-1 TaxID=2012676 RepID=A0A1Z2RVF9_9VIRU|nr:ORF3 [Torque teno Leptonychotes weddellii virus 1]